MTTKKVPRLSDKAISDVIQKVLGGGNYVLDLTDERGSCTVSNADLARIARGIEVITRRGAKEQVDA